MSAPLSRLDPRAVHVLEVLRRKPGDSFDVGVVNGPRGKAILREVTGAHLLLEFSWGGALPPLPSIVLLIGLPRPQTARKILQEAATFGVTALNFVATERGEPQYAQSTLWTSGEWRRHLIAGAEQAFDTRIPEVTWGRSLAQAIADSSGVIPSAANRGMSSSLSLALDNYEATRPLSACEIAADAPLMIALGPERGWGPQDRAMLRDRGFILAHLGERVLRAETAMIAALSIVAGKTGRM